MAPTGVHDQFCRRLLLHSPAFLRTLRRKANMFSCARVAQDHRL